MLISTCKRERTLKKIDFLLHFLLTPCSFSLIQIRNHDYNLERTHPFCSALGFRLLAEEEAAWFPEKELRSAQDITPQRFTALERALLCLSVSTESLKASMAFV